MIRTDNTWWKKQTNKREDGDADVAYKLQRLLIVNGTLMWNGDMDTKQGGKILWL